MPFDNSGQDRRLPRFHDHIFRACPAGTSDRRIIAFDDLPPAFSTSQRASSGQLSRSRRRRHGRGGGTAVEKRERFLDRLHDSPSERDADDQPCDAEHREI